MKAISPGIIYEKGVLRNIVFLSTGRSSLECYKILEYSKDFLTKEGEMSNNNKIKHKYIHTCTILTEYVI